MKHHGRLFFVGVLSIAALGTLGACSKKCTDPKDLSTKVIEVPDDPNEKERRELFKQLEELLEYNEGFLEAPTRKQRQVADRNTREISEFKEKLGYKTGAVC